MNMPASACLGWYNESMKRGKFIVLDGIDGSGKGAQVINLATYLFNKEKTNHVFLTREPYHSEYYAEIRKILKETKDVRGSGERLTELFVKDRRVHVGLIEQLLSQGIQVISDRYKYSTLAYQQTQGISLDKLMKMHEGILVPDLTLIVDVPAKTALERIAKDKGRQYLEMFEEKNFQEELRKNFLALPKLLPEEKIVIIDGDRPIEEVFRSIRQETDKLI